MSKLNKGYKFRIYPNDEQKQFFEQNFGNARFIYNKMLSDKIKYYELHKEQLNNTPAQYKKEFEFLKLSDSLSLSNAQLHLQKAFRNFFNNPKKYGFPKFKSKGKSKSSYTTNNQGNTIAVEDGFLKLPKMRKLGPVKINQHRKFIEGSIIKSATIERKRSNKYYVSILVEYEKEIVKVEPKEYIGLDFAMQDFYVDSEGNKGNYPKFYRNSQDKLTKEQRKLSKMIKYSNNYNKQKVKIAKIHEKIANQREDFLHKRSRKIANSYDVVCVEDLNMQSMSKTLKFGKSVHDIGWGMFVKMLEYKLENLGKYLVRANKFFPSTKQCSSCRNKKDKVLLAERWYSCTVCGHEQDRDVNAAMNLKNYAIDKFELQLE